MDTRRSVRPWSRRRFLGTLGALSGAALVAACSQPSSSAPAKPAESKPADAKPAAPAAKPADAKPAAPAAAPAATTAPAAAAPAAEPKVTSGVFNVWFSANWNEVTDKAIGDSFVKWGQQNGGLKVEWQSIPGSPQILSKQSAALAAGQPPEVVKDYMIYWYNQGEMADVKNIATKFKDKAGGMYDISFTSLTANDGGMFAIPWAIDVWPPQWRIDIIGAANNGQFFETWDKLIEIGPKIQKPPQIFTFAMAIGHEGDHVNNLVTILWAYGGRLNDEKGVPDIKNPSNKAGLEIVKKLWDAKLMPPEGFAQTVTSYNNETYQKGRALVSINPATIMGWLLVNDKELADKTGIAQPPKGTAGTFAEGAALAFNYFKKAKLADKAPSALEAFMDPGNLEGISKAVEGRFVPIYRDHAKGDFWEKSKFAEMRKIAENGRVRNWPAPAQAWLDDVTDAKYTLSDMMSKILKDGMSIEDAQNWAQGEMMDAYDKAQKKA
jgi:ABC-type glycerol-3-phosphate transport system substrate-binding protein